MHKMNLKALLVTGIHFNLLFKNGYFNQLFTHHAMYTCSCGTEKIPVL